MNRKYTFLCIALLLLLGSCQLGRFVFYNFADVKDYKKFPYRMMHAHNRPFQFVHSVSMAARPPLAISENGKELSFDKFLDRNQTIAFLIIHDDTLVYEHYARHYDSSAIVPSFSMAKSMTSALIGCAIADKYIQSVDQPVTDFIPELKPAGFDSVTIKHLLQMTSGIAFSERYTSPFSDAAGFYYGTNLEKKTLALGRRRTPGIHFEYTSGSTQLLGMVLQRVLRKRNESLTHYFDRRIWFPLEMQFDGTWSTDDQDEDKAMEKTFCCVNARALDFAKFGRLYLHNGNWNGKQIIPAKWVTESTTPDLTNGGVRYYKYQWWLGDDGSYAAEGHLGQYIYVNPAKKLVIVRLGKNYGKVNWNSVFHNYAETVE